MALPNVSSCLALCQIKLNLAVSKHEGIPNMCSTHGSSSCTGHRFSDASLLIAAWYPWSLLLRQEANALTKVGMRPAWRFLFCSAEEGPPISRTRGLKCQYVTASYAQCSGCLRPLPASFARGRKGTVSQDVNASARKLSASYQALVRCAGYPRNKCEKAANISPTC